MLAASSIENALSVSVRTLPRLPRLNNDDKFYFLHPLFYVPKSLITGEAK